MPEAGIMVARESFLTDWEGQRRIFAVGQTTIREGHPILKGREHMFEPFKVDYELPGNGRSQQGRPAPGSRSQARQDD